MKFLKVLLAILTVLIIAYFLGPKPKAPILEVSAKAALPGNIELVALEKLINQNENNIPNIKPGNASQIVWADSVPQVTEYSVVYLHGFSASPMEGDPVHKDFARAFGCNLYIPRLHAHGLESPEPFLDYNNDSLLLSAAEALEVGRRIGEKVILMGTSNGGTLSLILASQNPDIAAVIAYSPNIEINNSKAWLLTKPWGLQMARIVQGNKYKEDEESETFQKYWYTKYRLEAVVRLQSLVENTMIPETFQKVKQPFFMGYYYKNEVQQDSTVRVDAMLRMFDQLGTPPEKKRKVAFPEAGAHVICSDITSNDVEGVRRETIKFAQEILGLKPVLQ